MQPFREFLQNKNRSLEQSLDFCSLLLNALLAKKDLFLLGYINDNYIGIKVDGENISVVCYDVPKLLNTPLYNSIKNNACLGRSAPEFSSTGTGSTTNNEPTFTTNYAKLIVYSLGTIFRDLFLNKDDSLKFTTTSIDNIKPLILAMMDNNPDKRPDLKDIIETIATAIKTVATASETKPTSQLSEDTKPITTKTTLTTLSTNGSAFFNAYDQQQMPDQYLHKDDTAPESDFGNLNNNTSQSSTSPKPRLLLRSISSSQSESETRSNTPSPSNSPSKLKTRPNAPSQVQSQTQSNSTTTTTSRSGSPLLRSSSILRPESITPARRHTPFCRTTTSDCQQLNSSTSSSRDDLTTTREF